jgi:hypothetical protein
MKLTELQGTSTLLDAARAAGLHRAQGRESLVSAKTDDLADAKRELKRLTRNRDDAREGKEPLMTPKAERVTVADLLDANLRRAETQNLASLSQISNRTETLKNLLGQVRALEFRPEHVDLYKERRKRGEALRWEWFDGRTWTLMVPSEKGGQAREFAIEGSLRRVFERRLAAPRLGCPFVFKKDGKALIERHVRLAFYEALEECGLPTGRTVGFTLYDTKKTAAGLLIDSGLSEREAMHFSGHATPSMFDRYIVKSSERHRENVKKRDEYLERRLAEKHPPTQKQSLFFQRFPRDRMGSNPTLSANPLLLPTSR